jgi:DNA transformation protein and related proteins
MAVTSDYLTYVQEQLSLIPGIFARRMFGGVGLMFHGRMFGLLAGDVFYLKVDDSNRADYEIAGMEPFIPFAGRPTQTMPYYEVPADVLEDRTALAAWARRAIVVADRAAKKKKAPAKKSSAKKSSPARLGK